MAVSASILPHLGSLFFAFVLPMYCTLTANHLAEVDTACQEYLETLLPQMMQHEGVDETLKACDQMEWVRRMNSIQNRAEEILLNELVYA